MCDILGTDAKASETFKAGAACVASAAAVLAEAVIVASLTASKLSKEAIKQKLTLTTTKLAEQSGSYGVDMNSKVHPTLLSEATRFLRES